MFLHGNTLHNKIVFRVERFSFGASWFAIIVEDDSWYNFELWQNLLFQQVRQAL